MELSTVEASTVERSAPRRHLIRNAQDVLNPYEEALYDALWGVPKKAEGERSRICQKGYSELARTAKLSKRAVQDMIPRLAAKGFLEVIAQHGLSERTSKAYRVLSYAAVREYQRQSGKTHWIKEGRGRAYDQSSTVECSTVEASTVEKSRTQSSTVAPDESSTVAPNAPLPYKAFKEGSGISSSSVIADALARLTGEKPDDDAVHQLVAACQARDADITEEAIAALVERKLRSRPRISHSIMGFLITAVPKMIQSREGD